ncbi:MAG: hypothetical protein ACU0B7_05020 [Paracoccaceae bacterium]
MKPNFALTLSFDGIGLLHRAASGWHVVGEVALDTDDLAADLAVLRRTAVQLDSAGLRSKLVLPNEQIRYLSLPAPAKGVDVAAHVADALDGTTPYDVADLRFDWIIVGNDLHIAAVALETLDEAEAFAEEYGFGPVSFVATPAADSFPGEPFFGLAKAAARLIDPSDRLMRDSHAIRVLGRATLPVPKAEGIAADQPVLHAEPNAAPLADTTTADTPMAPDQLGSSDTVETAADSASPKNPASEGYAAHVATRTAEDTTGSELDSQSADEKKADDADSAPDALPSFSSRRRAPELPEVRPAAPRRPIVVDLPPLPKSSPALAATRAGAPVTPPLTGFAETGPSFAGKNAKNKSAAPALADETLPQPAAFRSPPASAAPTASQADSAGVLAPLLRRLAGADAEADGTTATPPGTKPAFITQSEKQRLTIFGARKPDSAMAMTRGRPRFLGLIMTGILLLFMAAVAAWSAMVSDTGFIKGFFGAPDTEFASQPPDGEQRGLADALVLETAPRGTAPDQTGIELARLDSSDMLTDLTAEELAPGPADTAPADTSAATDPDLMPDGTSPSYAASGIWQVAPAQPDAPPAQTLDDLYLASIDTSLQNFDAVALPEPRRSSPDNMPVAQSSPAPQGTRFDMDARGLVRATPQGAQTPDGIMVFAGRPPVTPEGMPTRFERTPAAETQADPALAAFRPRERPDTLAESNERAQLGGLSRSELSNLRPRLRPATLAAVAQALQEDDTAEAAEDEAEVAALETATAQAIATSLKPLARPRNFASTVDNTRQRQQQQPAPQQVAAAATLAPQRNAAPQIPSSASVAQQATVRGAINLRQVNLIGVYGQPSNRRALVRLSNGRYQKVQVGDRLDGGQVRAIGESELSYVKGNRAIVLTMPRG